METGKIQFGKLKTFIAIAVTFIVIVANCLVLTIPAVGNSALGITGNALLMQLLDLIVDDTEMQDELVVLAVVALVYFLAAIAMAILFFVKYFKSNERSMLKVCCWINRISLVMSLVYFLLAYLLAGITGTYVLFVAIFILIMIDQMVAKPIWGNEAKQKALLAALKPYQDLLTMGVITEEEFASKKAEIIQEYLK